MITPDDFGADYFRNRVGNDPLRQRSFQLEKAYLESKLGADVFSVGRLLDVGCSTGEFIEAISWPRGNAYGMEVSEFARSIAESKGIRFDRDLFSVEDFFDLIVFRGTIQYISRPFDYIARCRSGLKPGGHVIFLATPNTDSPFYRQFKTLPFLEERLNYWIPCATSLRMVLKNSGLEICDVQYPYRETPYAHLLRDHWRYLRRRLFNRKDSFAFWRSSMTVLARRPL